MINEADTSDITFSLTLDADQLRVKAISDTLRDIEKLLADVEIHVRGTPNSSVEWRWGAGSELQFIASVNGVSKEQLERIVDDAQSGFENASRAALDHVRVQWPESFGKTAIKHVNQILKRLQHFQSITVQAEKRKPVVIETAEINEIVVGRKPLRARRRVHSSVDGCLELISHRGKLRAAIKEHHTGHIVQCVFPDNMVEKIKPLFDTRIVAEGLVSYREDGTPISVTDITKLAEKKSGRALDEFIGAAPDLTGGLSTEEFMSKLRGYDEQ